jgi:hypothetical protein
MTPMFDTLLIANLGENSCAAAVSAKPNRVARAARTGDLRASCHV